MTYLEAIALLASAGPKGRMSRSGSSTLRMAVGEEVRLGRYVVDTDKGAAPANLSRDEVNASDWEVQGSPAAPKEEPLTLDEPTDEKPRAKGKR